MSSFMVLIANTVEQLLILKQAMYFLCILSFNHNKVGVIITITQISEEIFSRSPKRWQSGGDIGLSDNLFRS